MSLRQVERDQDFDGPAKWIKANETGPTGSPAMSSRPIVDPTIAMIATSMIKTPITLFFVNFIAAWVGR